MTSETDRKITDERYNASRDEMEARFYTASAGAPPTDEQRASSLLIREAIVTAATVIEAEVPKGRNKALALTHLEDALMRGNRGIFAPEAHR